jgi:hypothetical protein
MENAYPNMAIHCWIDGVWVGTKLPEENALTKVGGKTDSFKGKRINSGELREFRFAAPVSAIPL